LNAIKARIIRILKLLFLVSVPIVAIWNLFIALVLILLANFKNIKKTLFGKLPLDVPKKSSVGPYTKIYKRESKKLYKIDIYYPTTGQTPFPVVVFAHGGGWISGFRSQPNNISWYRFLNYHGFAVATMDYRYGYRYHIRDIMKDYSDAVSYIQQNAKRFGLNPDQVILMGLSAGGHLSLLYATYFSKMGQKERLRGINAVVAWYSPADLLDMWDMEVASLFARFSTLTIVKEFPKKNRRSYEYFSPISWVSSRMIPTMLVHGLQDTIVPAKSSVKMFKKLREHGVQSKLKLHPTGGHCFEFELKDNFTKKILLQTVKFMKEHLCENVCLNENA